MTTPAIQLKPDTTLDRTNTMECVIDNLSKCRDLECQKAVLNHLIGSTRRAVRREIRTELAQYAETMEQQAEEQREEAQKLVDSAQQIRSMLDLSIFGVRREST